MCYLLHLSWRHIYPHTIDGLGANVFFVFAARLRIDEHVIEVLQNSETLVSNIPSRIIP